MPRKTLEIACLNVTMHPNPSPEKYVKLFQYLAESDKLYFNYHGKHSGALKNDIKPIMEKDLTKGFTGTVITFTDIDPKKPFININAKEPILDENNEPIPQLESYIKPDGKEHSYVFLPEYHRMIFDIEKITPQAMFKIMKGLASIADFDEGIIFTIEQSNDNVELIKKMPTLTKISIKISLPNGDSLRESIKEKIKDYNDRNIHKTEMNFTAIPKRGIVIDDDTIDWIDVSTSYGNTEAIGKDIYGKKQYLSTLDTPLVEKTEITPQIGYINSLIERGIILAKKIANKLK